MGATLRWAFAVVILVAFGAGSADAGSMKEPEISDPAGDGRIAYVDLVRVWVESDAGADLRIRAQLAGALPDPPTCSPAPPFTFVFVRYSLLGPTFLPGNAAVETYEVRASPACTVPPRWSFSMAVRAPGTCENCFNGGGSSTGKIEGDQIVFTPSLDSHGLDAGDSFVWQAPYALARIYTGQTAYNFLSDDRAPNTGVGRTFGTVLGIDVVETGNGTRIGPGTNDQVGVRLGRQPAGDVVVKFRGADGTIAAAPPTLTFTSATWSALQFVDLSAARTPHKEPSVAVLEVAVDRDASSDDFDEAPPRPINVTLLSAPASEASTAPGSPSCSPPASCAAAPAAQPATPARTPAPSFLLALAATAAALSMGRRSAGGP